LFVTSSQCVLIKTAFDCSLYVFSVYELIQLLSVLFYLVGKRYSNPIAGLDRPCGFQEVEAPRSQDNRQMVVVRLSAPRTGHLNTPGNKPGNHFC